jgi:flagellar basal body P-ring formation protein FlgA
MTKALVLLAAIFFASAASAESATVARVRSDLERFLGEHVEGEGASIEIPELRAFDYDVSRVQGKLRTELSTRSPMPFHGRISVAVALFVGDQLVKRAVVSPNVRFSDRVVVTARALSKGDVIAREDLVLSTRDRAELPGDAIRDLESLVGLRTKRGLSGDQLVRSGDFESVPLVERGDRVMLVLEAGALRIQAAGEARERGAAGDWIRVVNLDSKREISGRVDPEGRVHVAF